MFVVFFQPVQGGGEKEKKGKIATIKIPSLK